MLKKLMITTALTGFMIGTAAAQTSTPAQNMPANPPAGTTQYAPKSDMKPTAASAQFVSAQKPDQWLASKFRGTDVIGADNQKIGSVNDILFDKDGKILAYVISVGGFLGMGSKDVALAPSSFQVIAGDKSKNETDKLKVSMNADQLKQAANFEPYQPPRATTGTGPIPRPMNSNPPASTR